MKIVWCLDKNFMEYAKISIASYRKHNPRAEIIVVSEKPIPNEIGYDKNIVIKMNRTHFKGKDNGINRISRAAYLKLYLPKLPYKKILFVDGDTVCQKPLDKLWRMPCKYITMPESHIYGKKQAEEFGMKKYGCAGVMLMNLPNLKKYKFTEKCLFLEEHMVTQKTGWQYDETLINLLMKNDLKIINPKYGYCHNRQYEKPIRESDAYILHYIGDDKREMITGGPYPELWPIKKYIEGKSVAIVGNAESIFDKPWGPYIDGADFVIRFNKGFIKNPRCQGTKTSFLILATNITKKQLKSYNAQFVANRSAVWKNKVDMVIGDKDKRRMKNFIGSQPTSGFIAIDIALCFGARTIELFGFDFGKTPTFYNPKDYVTPHDYPTEKKIIEDLANKRKIFISR